MPAAAGIDELRRDAHAIAGLADAALEQKAHAQVASDLLHFDRPALVGEGGVARDHEQARGLREVGDQVFGHAVAEIFLLRIAAHVLEGQDGDRWLVGQRKHRTSRSTVEADTIHPHRLRDVLQLLIAKVLISKTDFCADFLVDLAGHADTARFRDSLQPRSDVDAVAEDSIIVVDNVTEVDADTKLHTPLGLDCGIAFDHLPLNGDCAFDCVQHTGELGQYAVSGRIDDTSAKLANHRQHDRLMALEVAHRPRFVRTHQGAIAGDVCGQDGCKPARPSHDRPSGSCKSVC